MLIWLVLLAAVIPAVFVRGFRHWLSSIQGAVWILSVLAVLSVLGVAIGQKLPLEAYVSRHGEIVGPFLMRIGLTDVFASWYYLFLVSLLAVSIVACSLGRLSRVRSAPGRSTLARLGTLVTHIALVVILAGGVVTAVRGYRYPAARYLAAGDEMEVTEGGFTVRVDAATTQFTEDGAVSEYYSDVAVVEDGIEIKRHRIEVNHPLIHNGVGLYQHEMLPSATSVNEVLLGYIMRTPEGEEDLREIVLPFREETAIPGTDVSLKVLEFLSDFTYDIERRTAELASWGHRNPAVLVRLSESGQTLGEQWLFADLPSHQDDSGLPCRLFFLDYAADFQRGLTLFEISKQPGTPLVYVGFLAMSLGLCVTFWTRGPAVKRKDGDR